jgi:hypothetical protein
MPGSHQNRKTKWQRFHKPLPFYVAFVNCSVPPIEKSGAAELM